MVAKGTAGVGGANPVLNGGSRVRVTEVTPWSHQDVRPITAWASVAMDTRCVIRITTWSPEGFGFHVQQGFGMRRKTSE